MNFWTFMLHCRGGAYYVGHTEDIDRRLWEHENGALPGFTSGRLPVKPVWCANFSNRDDAKNMEHRLKGWSRAKKMALIRDDWAEVSRLARSRTGLRQAQASGELEIPEQSSARLSLSEPRTSQ